VSPDALHVSYICSPMRYAWDQQFAYLQGAGTLGGGLMRLLLHRLRLWDHRSAAGVDSFVADSAFVARRILKAWRREAAVIYPPVDTEAYRPGERRADHYVTVSRLWTYKRVDLLVEAFRAMPERRLVVIGEGPELRSLRSRAGPNVEFLGHQPAEALQSYVQTARAFLFAAIEDFGIAPVEAMASGTPVIALRRGGAAETVLGLEADAPTGVFFEEQSAPAVVQAIREFEQNEARITPQACRARAEQFSAARFRAEFTGFVEKRYAEWREYRAALTRRPAPR
jgi:glycosyltransferase involved in cell wall biosynthesis